MRIKDIDNYIIDVLWLDAWSIGWKDLTKEQQEEYLKFNKKIC